MTRQAAADRRAQWCAFALTAPLVAPLAATLVAALLGACASQPERYYTLASAATAVAAPASGPARGVEAAPVFIEMAPVVMPEYLAREQFVVLPPGTVQGARVEILEQHRWASSFENELRDALGSGIAARLGAVDVTKSGYPGSAPDGSPPRRPPWRIAVQLNQFDAVENTRVAATFSWTVRRADERRSTTCRWHTVQPIGAGLDALAEGVRRTVAELSGLIAAQLARNETPCGV